MRDAPFALETRPRGSATLSACGRYRYDLARDWGPVVAPRRACFVMLNPSTADATRDDATLRRCVGFARAWGLGGVSVVNLFALRATDPADLLRDPEPVGPLNDAAVLAHAAAAEVVVCAWGAKGGHLGRDRVVLNLLRKSCRPQCLRLTGGGHPEHPLYLPAGLEPFDLPDPASPLRLFEAREVRAAIQHALDGGQALHIHRFVPDRGSAPAAFVAAVDRGEVIAHLFDQDAERLARTVRGFGVRRVAVQRPGTAKQHHDLCGAPLRRAMEAAGA